MATLEIEPKAYTMNKERDVCLVTAELGYKFNGKEKEKMVVFTCKLMDDAWYITKIE